MGIIGSAAVMSFGGVTTVPGVPPNHAQIWYNAGGCPSGAGPRWLRMKGRACKGAGLQGAAAALGTPHSHCPALPSVPPPPPPAALQCAIQLCADFVLLAWEEKFHAFNWAAAWPPRVGAAAGWLAVPNRCSAATDQRLACPGGGAAVARRAGRVGTIPHYHRPPHLLPDPPHNCSCAASCASSSSRWCPGRWAPPATSCCSSAPPGPPRRACSWSSVTNPPSSRQVLGHSAWLVCGGVGE